MMRKPVSILLMSVVSVSAFALGLGNIELNSGLNQPFDARIELLSPTAAELDSLEIRLADEESFRRAGVERIFILTSLRFQVIESDTGRDYIRISTREPIREPFLNFLVEAAWANGRLYREYTVLLDPPLYDPDARRPIISDPGRASSTSASDDARPVPRQDVTPARSGTGYISNEYGPVSSVDTLWSISGRIRPDSSVTIQQMMLALLRANPEAFIENNINGLKRGQILRVPDRDDITTTSSEQAYAEVLSQNAIWEDLVTNLADSALPRSQGSSAQPGTGVSGASAAGGQAELRLLAAGRQGGGSGGGNFAENGSENLALANEQLQALTSENLELRDQVQESEALIEDLRRLIELKDDELAALQSQLATASSETAEPAPVSDEEFNVSTEDDSAQQSAAVEDESDAGSEAEEAVTTAVESVTTVTQARAAAPSAGLMDQVIGYISGNLVMLGAALGGLLLLIFAALFVRNKRMVTGNDDTEGLEEFAALNIDKADETELPGSAADEPEINFDIDVDDGHGKEEEVAAAEDQESPEATADIAGLPETADATADKAAAPEAETDDDLLAEVNVFLAYEHFDQAEEFVRDAIKNDPENLDFHSKLLEVFYSAGDKVKYEEEAKVLHDLVDGSGPHWDMAMIMWQEMSPNRQLFAEGGAETEDDSREDISGGGIVDLTADTESGNAGLDFDLGTGGADETGTPDAEGLLDITAGSDDVLDVTAESGVNHDEDILDVTAAVGLDRIDTEENTDENLFDITGDGRSPESDDAILDISTSGAEDLLDVTASVDLGVDNSEEDLLDVTAVSAGTDSDEHTLDFNMDELDTMKLPVSSGEDKAESGDDNFIDFDSVSVAEESGEDEQGIELDFGSDDDSEKSSGADFDISLDLGNEDEDSEIGLDFDNNDTSAGSMEESLDAGTDFDSAAGIELDLGSGDDSTGTAFPEIDMESTVQIPKSTGSLSLEDIDGDDDHTVFVPRTADVTEQSAADEIATKLDLAKAYVELGDSESAKSILDEIIAEGDASQQQQARELMRQVS